MSFNLVWLAKQVEAPFRPMWKILLKPLWDLLPPIGFALIGLHSGYDGLFIWAAFGLALVYAYVLSVLCATQNELLAYCKKFHESDPDPEHRGEAWRCER